LNRGRQMETLYALSDALIADITLDAMLETITARLTRVLHARSCAILLPDDSGMLNPRATLGPQPTIDDREHCAIAAWVFDHQLPASVGQRDGGGSIFRFTLPIEPAVERH
ncbi:MAG: hypothetical protein WD628_00330, partial [Thermomicrobiales bacterium]